MEMRQIHPLACLGSRWQSVAKWPFVAFLVLARGHGDAKPPRAHGLSRRGQERGELATVAISSDGKDVDVTRSVASVATPSDRYYVPIPGHIHRAGREITRRRLQDVLAPPSHHWAPALDVVGPVVGAAHLILVDMRQCDLNEFRVPPMFIQDGAGAIERMPWLTSRSWKPMRFNAMLAVWLLAWVRGSLSAGKTYSRWPL